MTRKSWKLSDTVAAVFFGIWISSILFRPFFGGLDIIILIVSAVWAASLWARKQGEEPPVPLTKDQEENRPACRSLFLYAFLTSPTKQFPGRTKRNMLGQNDTMMFVSPACSKTLPTL